MELILFAARALVSLAFLAYASWSDIKTREISNTVWAVYAPIAFLLTFAQFLLYPPVRGDVLQSLLFYGGSVALITVFAVVLFYAGAFGGADAKALMCIAVALPLPPEPISPLSGFVSIIFPITVFSNGVILAAVSVVYALLRNLLWRQQTGQRLFEGHEHASRGRKALALLSGYKVRLADLEKSFLYPLEDVQTTAAGNAERRLLVFPKDERREEIVGRLVQAQKDGQVAAAVWATPGLPMLIFITLGLVLALTVGDIVWLVMRQIL